MAEHIAPFRLDEHQVLDLQNPFEFILQPLPVLHCFITGIFAEYLFRHDYRVVPANDISAVNRQIGLHAALRALEQAAGVFRATVWTFFQIIRIVAKLNKSPNVYLYRHIIPHPDVPRSGNLAQLVSENVL